MANHNCRTCGVKLIDQNWWPSCKTTNNYICKTCGRKRNKKIYRNNKKEVNERAKQWCLKNRYRFWAIVVRSKHRKRGNEVLITTDQLEEMAKATKFCLLCGKELDWSIYTKSRKPKTNSPSLDRKENGLVLTKENVWILCHKCNTMKQDLPFSQYIEHCKMVVDKFG